MHLGKVHLKKITLEPDIILFLVGVINKFLSHLLGDNVGHLATLKLTLWMVGDHAVNTSSFLRRPYDGFKSLFKISSSTIQGTGITQEDSGLEEEMTKPWMAIIAFCKLSHPLPARSKWRSIMRLTLTLVISICFTLAGAGMNTIGIPKALWHPDEWLAGRQVTLRMTEVGWMNYWGETWTSVGGGPPSWPTALSVASAKLFTSISTNFGLMYDVATPGWEKDVSELLPFGERT